MDNLELSATRYPGVPKLTFRVNEVVAATGIGRTTIYALIREGKLKTKKVRTCTVIEREELERMLKDLPSGDPDDDLSID